MKIIEAVYEKGVFRPLQKVDLKEGGKIGLGIEKPERFELLNPFLLTTENLIISGNKNHLSFCSIPK